MPEDFNLDAVISGYDSAIRRLITALKACLVSAFASAVGIWGIGPFLSSGARARVFGILVITGGFAAAASLVLGILIVVWRSAKRQTQGLGGQ